jgi:hypothetical protein
MRNRTTTIPQGNEGATVDSQSDEGFDPLFGKTNIFPRVSASRDSRDQHDPGRSNRVEAPVLFAAILALCARLMRWRLGDARALSIIIQFVS